MSSIVYLRNPKTNTIYAYLNESVWDPEKKRCVNKRKCIGHVDAVTGEIVPNRKNKSREKPVVKAKFLTDVFNKVASDTGLSEMLSLAFPDSWKRIITAAYYLVATEGELFFCKQWSEENITPYNHPMTIQVMNELVSNISSNSISLFFTLWKRYVQPEETYVSTISFRQYYREISDYSKGMNIDLLSNSNRMKMDIYFSSKTNTPICYYLSNMATGRVYGDYDVFPESFTRLASFMDEENGDIVDPSVIAYANSNLIVRLRPDNDYVSSLVEKVEPMITNPENYRTLMGVPMFTVSYMQHINGKKFYVHIFYDPNKAASDLSTFINIINLCRDELETNHLVESHQDLYEKYLLIREENSKTIVEMNTEAIMHHNKYLGFTAILSNFTRNPSMVMIPFIQKNSITNTFENMNNDYDNTSLNLFSTSNYLGRLFIQFIALILRSEVENIMSVKKLNKTLTFKEMVTELSSIKMVKVPGLKKPIQTFVSDEQARILRAFDIKFDED